MKEQDTTQIFSFNNTGEPLVNTDGTAVVNRQAIEAVDQVHTEVHNDPYRLIQEYTFTERFGNTIKTFFSELPKEGRRLKRIGALAIGAATQLVDRGRAMVFILPTTFDRTITYAAENGLNAYQTAGVAGVSVAGAFGLYAYGIGKAFHKSLNEFPETTEATAENHPVMVETVKGAVSGFPKEEEIKDKYGSKPDDGYDIEPYETRDTILGKIMLGFNRGAKTGLLYGTTAQTGIAKIDGHSDKSIDKRLKVASTESALFFGGLAVGMSTLLTHDFMGMAEQIRDTITDRNVLLSAAGFFIGWSAIANKLERRKTQKELVSADIIEHK